MRLPLAFATIFLFCSCEDRSTSSLPPDDMKTRLALVDATPRDSAPDVRLITQWDAAIPDMAPDAEPIVCDRLGMQEECEI